MRATTEQTTTVHKKATAGEVVTASFRAQTDRLRAAELAVRTGEPDGVHDMRVAVTRMRAVSRTFRKVLGPSARRLRSELAWLADVLGQARDTEVLGRRLAAEIAATPTELVLGPVPAELDRYLARDAANTRAAVLTAIDTPRYGDLLVLLDTIAPAADEAAIDVLPRMVRKAFQRADRMAEAAEQATGAARDDALHQVRKAVKRVRYATEAVAPVVGPKADRYRRRCRDLQRVLGDHHDTVVARRVLRGLGIQAHADRANAFTFGLLHGRLGMVAARRDREFAHLWHRIAAKKARKWM
jgi:CHAD domain-containing protein